MKQAKRFIIASIAGIAIAVAIMVQSGLFSVKDIAVFEIYRILCDACFVSGIAVLCVGGLSEAAKHGAYNFFTYNGRALLSFFIPQKRKDNKKPYNEYILDKADSRKNIKTTHYYIIGGVLTIVSFIFLALYYFE